MFYTREFGLRLVSVAEESLRPPDQSRHIQAKSVTDDVVSQIGLCSLLRTSDYAEHHPCTRKVAA